MTSSIVETCVLEYIETRDSTIKPPIAKSQSMEEMSLFCILYTGKSEEAKQGEQTGTIHRMIIIGEVSLHKLSQFVAVRGSSRDFYRNGKCTKPLMQFLLQDLNFNIFIGGLNASLLIALLSQTEHVSTHTFLKYLPEAH